MKKKIRGYVYQFNVLLDGTENYHQFHQRLSKLDVHIKGVMQEILARQYFLAYAKHYNIKKYYCRIMEDIPPEEVNSLDVGSDGVILHLDGTISLVQVKYRSNYRQFLHRSCIGGMALEAMGVGEHFGHMYLFSNTAYEPKKLSERERSVLKFILGDKLLQCDWSLIQSISLYDESYEKVEVVMPELRDWQCEAKNFVLEEGTYFGRKTVVAACGAGKTLFADTVVNLSEDEVSTSLESGEPFSSKSYIYPQVLILVPNLHLLGQWFENMALWHPDREYLLVGSDLNDADTSIPYTLTTDVQVINDKWLANEELLCICTYQSLPKVMESVCYFDLTICDEAHVTCGSSGAFNLPTQEEFISDNILYLTATPRIYKGVKKETCVSMDDEEVYGPQYLYSFKRAIEEDVISDYKIILGCGQGDYDQVDFNAEFLRKSIEKQCLHSVLVCSSSHVQSKALYQKFKEIYEGDHELILMPSGASSQKKAEVVSLINSEARVIVFNVRVLALGSDLIPLESVMLAGNRRSIIDTVQTISRCLRKYPSKDHGTVLVPCLIETEDFDGPGGFANVRNFLGALATIDSAIVDEVVLRSSGSGRSDKISVDVVMGSYETVEEELEEVGDFELRIYDRLGNSASFSPYLRFEAFLRFCEKEGRLPKYGEKFEEINVGEFLKDLLSGKNADKLDGWLQRLFQIPGMKEIWEERIAGLEKKRAEPKPPTPEQRFEALLSFCEKEKRLPPTSGEKFEEINVGKFLNSLLSGQHVKKLNGWLQRLFQIPGMKEIWEERIAGLEKERAKPKPTPEQRFEALLSFCKKEKRLPSQGEKIEEIDVGIFLTKLLSGQHAKKRNDWFKQLLSLPSITEQMKKRLLNNGLNPEDYL